MFSLKTLTLSAILENQFEFTSLFNDLAVVTYCSEMLSFAFNPEVSGQKGLCEFQ